MFKGAIAELRQQVQDDPHLGFRRISSILSKNPSNNLHERIWDVRVLLQDLKVDLDGALSELFTLFSTLILRNRPNEFVGQLLSDVVATSLKQFVHIANIPVLIGSEILTQVGDFIDEIFA